MKIKKIIQEELAAEIKKLSTPGAKVVSVHGPDGGVVRKYILQGGKLRESNVDVPQANLSAYKFTAAQMESILARLGKMIDAGDFDGNTNGFDIYINFDGKKLDLTTKINKDPL